MEEYLKRGAEACPRDLERLCERLCGEGDLDLEIGVVMGVPFFDE